MTDCRKSTSSAADRKKILLTVRRMYDLVFAGLAQADRTLSNMFHLLEASELSSREVHEYHVEIVRQRGGIYEALQSSYLTSERLMPKYIREQYWKERRGKRRRKRRTSKR